MLEKYKFFKQKLIELFEKYRIGISLFLSLFIIFSGTAVMVQGARAQNKQNNVITSKEIQENNKTKNQENNNSEGEITEEKAKIVFDIEGAVKNPGVYRLGQGSVLVDAVNAAGGFSTEADTDRIAKELNQASIIGNNSKIYIFKKSDKGVKIITAGSAPSSLVSATSDNLPSSSSNSSRGSLVDTKININIANLSELDSLPGIGPAIGQRIIDWREANGGFEVIEDIKKVKGIGDSLFDGIKNLIVVE